MKTIREYFYSPEMTAEEFDAKIEEEDALWKAIEENEDFDLEGWAQSHGVDLEARDDQTGELVFTLWAWDMDKE